MSFPDTACKPERVVRFASAKKPGMVARQLSLFYQLPFEAAASPPSLNMQPHQGGASARVCDRSVKVAMRQAHASIDVSGMARAAKSLHLGGTINSPRDTPMFVRAVWRIKRLVDIKQTLREMDVPSTRDADLLGLSGPDFSKMTRSLFDR